MHDTSSVAVRTHVGFEEMNQPVTHSLESNATKEEDEQDEIREGCRDINHLKGMYVSVRRPSSNPLWSHSAWESTSSPITAAVIYLPRRCDALDHTQVAKDPRQDETESNFEIERSGIFDIR